MCTFLRVATSAWGAAFRLRLVYLTIYLLLFIFPAVAQTLPTGFVSAKAQDGYSAPMGVVFSADTRQLFVWDKAGRIWASNWNGVQYVRQTTPVLDISDEVGNWRDFGVISLCLDPNFSQNGRIYLYYVVDRYHLFNKATSSYNPTGNEYYKATISRITRYSVVTSNGTLTADPNSRFVLLGENKKTGVPLTHESHAGGAMVFGRDGTLLVATGDNASYSSTDIGSAAETYWQQAISDSIMRPNENVGSFRSQMPTSLCGKVLRLDPETGNGVPGNPFFESGNVRSARSRVWALGLRNPYRMTIQANTGSTNRADANPGSLLIGDVGWNNWEDFHIIRRGAENAGWPMFEGLEANTSYTQAAQTLQNKDEPNPTNTCNKPFLTFADLLKQAQNEALGSASALNPCSLQPLPGPQLRYFHCRPALDWRHGADIARYPTFNGTTATATSLGSLGATVPGSSFRGNCATGGAWYSGTRFPAGYRDVYYFADYQENWIRLATLGTNGVTEVRTFAPTGFGRGIVDLEYNPLDQSLYYVNINTGEIMRISYGGNQPPVARISSDKQTGSSPLMVTFRGDGSSDPDGDALVYAWDFGDGTSSSVANPVHTFSSSTSRGFTVRLTVTDPGGLSAQTTVTISVNNQAPTARITNPTNSTQYPLDRESQYTLTAAVTDEDPTSLTYAWQVVLRHNAHEHREAALTDPSPTVVLSPVGCDGETYYYLIKLTVTDRGGLTASDSVKVYPNCATTSLAVTNLKADPQNAVVALSWTNPPIAFDKVLVAAKAGSGFLDKPSLTTYAADANFGGSGTSLEGGKVVYSGTGTNVTVTGLTNDTRYYFRVYTLKGTTWTGGIETSAVPVAPAPPPTPEPVTFDPNRCYRLTARVSNKALEVNNGGKGNGVAVVQRTYTGRAWQQWRFRASTNGYYQLSAVHSGKMMDVDGSSLADLAGIIQRSDNGRPSQQWLPKRNAEGYYSLQARHSGRMLDVRSNNTTEGGAIVQNTANTTFAQQWLIETVGCATASGRLADSSDDETATSPAFADNQPFQVYPNPAGSYVSVDLSGAAGLPVSLTMTDLLGRPVSNQTIDKAGNTPVRLSIGQLPGGTYLLLINPENQPRVIRRVVKLGE